MQDILGLLSTFNAADVLDVTIVALLIFGLTSLLRGTQAIALMRGLGFILLLLFLAALLNLRSLSWMLSNGVLVAAIAIPVIFQPELRRLLEQLGRGGFFSRQAPASLRDGIISEVVRAAERLSDRRHGALIVLQRSSSLAAFVETGVRLDAVVRAELLLNIFWPKTELHDGAVIVDNSGRLAAAAAVLPLSAARNLPNPKMGTRHRASLGISEVSDAICVVVSEETGRISITHDGRMLSRLDKDRLVSVLTTLYGSQRDALPLWARLQQLWHSIRQGQAAPQAK